MKTLENANFYMCDKTASESFFFFFFFFLRFIPFSIWLHNAEQNRIENLISDTVSKNFVIFAIFDKNLHLVFDELRCDKKMLQNQ